MESLVNPKPWVPYMNTKDCSQGFCSLFCPQWCYMIFPPPPPIEFPDDNPGPNFSPLVIAIIGILASAFLLVSYYAIISKYCGSTDSPRRQQDHDPNEESEGNEDPSIHEPWHVANNGLDEALIKSITVCKYKKGDGLIEGTDCSVCLSEFEEDEGVRLLPKCSHAFHVICIDTWLKSHSNCPLCRTNIVSINPLLLPPPPPVSESPPNNESSSEITQNEVISEDLEMGVREEEETLRNDEDLKTDEKDTIIEIKDENYKRVRRSVSMDFVCQERVSVADVLLLDQDEGFQNDVGPSKELPAVGMTKSSNINRGLHTVNSPVAIKRSFSSGRFSFPKRGRVRNAMIPL